VAGADIVIAAAGPLTGPNAALGEQLRRGVELAVDEINATGGLRGERLAIALGDDGCDPRKAVEVATGFVSAGARAVVGHYCSGASIPASKVYGKAGLVVISPASTHPRFTDEGGWNVLRLCPRDDAQADAAAVLIQRHFPGRRIAVVSDQSAATASLAARFRLALAELAVTPVFDEAYRPGAKAYDDLVGRLAASAPDVVYLAGSYVEGGLIVRELRERGSKARFIAADGLLTEDFWNVAGETGEGTLVTFTFDPRRFESARPVLERFKKSEFSAEGFTLYAYAAVQAWVAAAEATGGTDSASIAAWLRAGNRFNTVVGEISFDQKGDLTSPRLAWFKWQAGRYLEIDPATLEPPELDTTP
jgi:branched-chain amino acid transport system substrate-binding protein